MIPISSYIPAFSQKQQRLVPGCIPFHADLMTELNRIKTGYYASIIELLRQQPENLKQQYKAEHLPSITVSCRTKDWRNTENIMSHSGFICFDIDGKMHPHINNWEEIRDSIFKQKFVLSAFLSASGQGVAFICKIIPAQHKDVFEYTEIEMMKNNIIIDPSGKDVVRLRFVSYDPGIKIRTPEETEYLMPSEEFFVNKTKPGITPRPTSQVDSLQVFRQAMDFAGQKREFKDGEKHWYLMRVAIFCNSSGMSEEYCKATALKLFSSTTNADILKPIKNVYRCYKNKFGLYPPPKPEYSFKVLRWLLKYATKAAIRAKIHLYGRKTIAGEQSYTIGVPSKLLCFLMSIACPQFTWTYLEYNDEYFDAEKCKQLFEGGKYVDICNGEPILCTNSYPSNWDL